MEKRILFTTTIDVEVDKSWDWSIPSCVTFKSVVQGIPDILVPLFERYNAKPTFLVSPEVLENDRCIKVLKNIKNCELGTHLHGDLVEPKKTIESLAFSRTKEMQCSYPPDIEFHKIENLTKLFIIKLGFSPKSFRAGRFGARGHTIYCLEKLGYVVDSSVTPGVIHNYPEGNANFVNAPIQPYFPSKEDITKPGESSVLEVPVTIIPSKLRIFLLKTLARTRIATDKIVNIPSSFFHEHWLRPSFESLKNMIKICNRLIKDKTRDITVLNMMFHSVEVIPNANPYTRSDKDVQDFLIKIEGVLKYASENGCVFTTLQEAYHHYEEKRDLK